MGLHELISALVLLSAGHARALSLSVEHRWGNGEFSDAGSLTASLSPDGSLLNDFRFSRRSLTQKELQSFLEVAYKNGMYTLSVQSLPNDASGERVMASIPAYCLLASNFYEELSVELTFENSIIGLDYRTQCQNQSVAVEMDTDDFGFSIEPMAVEVRYPRFATQLSMDELVRRAESSEGGMSSEGRPDGQPQKSQKSFLQQNWVFLLAGAVIVFQVMGAVADPNAGQPNAAQQAQTRR